jgi:transposase
MVHRAVYLRVNCSQLRGQQLLMWVHRIGGSVWCEWVVVRVQVVEGIEGVRVGVDVGVLGVVVVVVRCVGQGVCVRKRVIRVKPHGMADLL